MKRSIVFLGMFLWIHAGLFSANFTIVGIGEDGKIKRAIKSNYIYTPPSSGDVGLVSKGKIYGTSRQVVSTIKLDTASGTLLVGGINDPLVTTITESNSAFGAFKNNVINAGKKCMYSNKLAKSTFMSSDSSLEAHSDSFYYANAFSGEDMIMTNNTFFYGNLKMEQQLNVQTQVKIVGDVYAGIGAGCTKKPLYVANYGETGKAALASRIWGSFVSRVAHTDNCFVDSCGNKFAVLIYERDGVVQAELNKADPNLSSLSLPRINPEKKSVSDLPYYDAQPAKAFRTINFTDGAADNFFTADENKANDCLKTRSSLMNALINDPDVLNLYFNILGDGAAWLRKTNFYTGTPYVDSGTGKIAMGTAVYKRFIKDINFSAVVDYTTTPAKTLLDLFNDPFYLMSSTEFKNYVRKGFIVLDENDPLRIYSPSDDASKTDISFTTGNTPVLLDTQGYYILGDETCLGNTIQNNSKNITIQFHTKKSNPVFRLENFEKLRAGNSTVTLEIYDPNTQLFFTTGMGDSNNTPYNIVFKEADASCDVYVKGNYNCWSNGTQYINSDFTSSYLPYMYDSSKLHFYISGNFSTRGVVFISSIMEINGNLTTESQNLVFIGSCKANGYIDLKNDNAFLVPECILDSGASKSDLELKSTMEVDPKSF